VENKREMFDGMRAYHTSEIAHTQHAIQILLALLAAAATVVVALLFPQTELQQTTLIAWSMTGIVSLCAVGVAFFAHLKISADHRTYANFGREYVATSDALGYYQPLTGSATALKANRNIGQGLGYRWTQLTIWALAAFLFLSTTLFSVLFTWPISSAEPQKKSPSTSCQCCAPSTTPSPSPPPICCPLAR